MSCWTVVCRDETFNQDLGEYLARSVPGEWEEWIYPSHHKYRLSVSETESAWSLAKALAEYLVVVRVDDWLRALLRRRYPSSDLQAEQFIIDRAHNILTADPDRVGDRLNWASAAIFRHAQQATAVVVDGVQWFLLQDIWREFEEAIDEAIDAYLLDEEYHAFVNVLRQLVREAKNRIDWIHVHFQPRRFYFETPAGERVGDALIDDMLDQADAAHGDVGDILVSALVTLAPRWITVHRGGLEDAGRDILLAVFDGHVLFCRGCGRCFCPRLDTDQQSF